MFRLPSRELLAIAAAALMALTSLVMSMVLSHRLQSRILEVQETTALRQQIFILADALRKAEAAQRFYIITGDPAHGAPVDAVEAALPERLAALREGLEPGTDESVKSLMDELESESAAALGALRRTMTVREQQGRDAALALVGSGEAHKRLTAVHEKLTAVMEQLEEQLQEQSRRMMRAEQRGHSAAVAAGIVAMVLAGVGIWQWRQGMRHRQREMELASEKARAEQMARDKGDFLAAMSHEVRTPLNAMLALSESLRESLPAGVQQDQATAVHNSGQALLRLVNDLLDLSRMDAGRMQLVREPVAVDAFLAGLRALLERQAAAAGVSLQITADSALPGVILADEGRLRQVALNLAGNALKFTPAGGMVRVRLEGERSAEGPMLVLEVKDNGCGIPASLQEAIFQPYVQGSTQPQGSAGGAGLGLAIVRQIVRLMDGTVRLQSQPEQGTTFRVTLPMVADDHSARAAAGAEPDQNAVAPVTRPARLSAAGAARLRHILGTQWPAASATLSSADIRALADSLAELGAAESSALLEDAAARLRQASGAFSVSVLSEELTSLPANLTPLIAS